MWSVAPVSIHQLESMGEGRRLPLRTVDVICHCQLMIQKAPIVADTKEAFVEAFEAPRGNVSRGIAKLAYHVSARHATPIRCSSRAFGMSQLGSIRWLWCNIVGAVRCRGRTSGRQMEGLAVGLGKIRRVDVHHSRLTTFKTLFCGEETRVHVVCRYRSVTAEDFHH